MESAMELAKTQCMFRFCSRSLFYAPCEQLVSTAMPKERKGTTTFFSTILSSGLYVRPAIYQSCISIGFMSVISFRI